jgi:hypothetical protein
MIPKVEPYAVGARANFKLEPDDKIRISTNI